MRATDKLNATTQLLTDVSISIDDEMDVDRRLDLFDEQARLQGVQNREQKTVKKLRDVLGETDLAEIKRLRKSEYLTMVVNARALKIRIRTKMIDRKFELSRMERASITTKIGMLLLLVTGMVITDSHLTDHHMSQHIKTATEAKEPALTTNVRAYNKLCAELSTLIKRDSTLRQKIAPVPIDVKTLYNVELNDELYQDCGLEEEETGELPAWLTDEGVRQGIRLMLEVERCNEELIRLADERCSMQEWFTEEWEYTQAAKHTAGQS